MMSPRRKVAFEKDPVVLNGDIDISDDDNEAGWTGWDNPFQESDLNVDADMILSLWRQGSLSEYSQFVSMR